jgi:hypothetical protein
LPLDLLCKSGREAGVGEGELKGETNKYMCAPLNYNYTLCDERENTWFFRQGVAQPPTAHGKSTLAAQTPQMTFCVERERRKKYFRLKFVFLEFITIFMYSRAPVTVFWFAVSESGVLAPARHLTVARNRIQRESIKADSAS